MSVGPDSGGNRQSSGCGITVFALAYSVGLVGCFGTAYLFLLAGVLHGYGNVGWPVSWITAAALLLAWGGILARVGWRKVYPAGKGDWLDRMMDFAMSFALLPLLPVIIAAVPALLFYGALLALVQLGYHFDPSIFILAGILAVTGTIFIWLAPKNEVLDQATDFGPKVGIGLAVLGCVLGYGFDFKVIYGLIIASVVLWAVTMLLIRSMPKNDPAHPARSRVLRLIVGLFVAMASAVLVAGLLGRVGFEVYTNWFSAK